MATPERWREVTQLFQISWLETSVRSVVFITPPTHSFTHTATVLTGKMFQHWFRQETISSYYVFLSLLFFIGQHYHRETKGDDCIQRSVPSQKIQTFSRFNSLWVAWCHSSIVLSQLNPVEHLGSPWQPASAGRTCTADSDPLIRGLVCLSNIWLTLLCFSLTDRRARLCFGC